MNIIFLLGMHSEQGAYFNTDKYTDMHDALPQNIFISFDGIDVGIGCVNVYSFLFSFLCKLMQLCAAVGCLHCAVMDYMTPGLGLLLQCMEGTCVPPLTTCSFWKQEWHMRHPLLV